jgi:hypothetical protein
MALFKFIVTYRFCRLYLISELLSMEKIDDCSIACKNEYITKLISFESTMLLISTFAYEQLISIEIIH